MYSFIRRSKNWIHARNENEEVKSPGFFLIYEIQSAYKIVEKQYTDTFLIQAHVYSICDYTIPICMHGKSGTGQLKSFFDFRTSPFLKFVWEIIKSFCRVSFKHETRESLNHLNYVELRF